MWMNSKTGFTQIEVFSCRDWSVSIAVCMRFSSILGPIRTTAEKFVTQLYFYG